MRRSQTGARLRRAFGFDRPTDGLGGIKNGELLGLAETEFDVLLTVDRKLSTQQRLTKFDIAVLLVRSPSNRLEDIRPLLPEILAALEKTSAGTLTVVGR